MRKIFHFDSSPDAYVADAAVLCCFDHRINLAVRKFLQHNAIAHPDMIVVAGGAKTLASPRNDFEQDFILEQIRLSIDLHACQRVILTSHSDCATYGGLARFKGDRDAESVHHKSELQRAAEFVRSKFPAVSVETYFVAFDGVWESKEEARDEPRAAG
ncbi:MAG TPA: carbonic anhydrase [Terriglobales bacterium]|nr:carbonic anhydrase [Terriglobales bacterium]